MSDLVTLYVPWILTLFKGSYNAIALGRYTNLVKIHGEHTRLCLNSLSLNLLTATIDDGNQQYQAASSCLAKACEGAVALVQYFADPAGTDSIVRYSGHVRDYWPKSIYKFAKVY